MPILETLKQVLVTGSVFLLVITVLVFVHELGHFWAAKAFGMHVDAFAVMMGGLRKTDLRDRLTKPLVSSWILYGIGLASVVLIAIAGAINSQGLFATGMFVLAFLLPIWVITRLAALYHVPILMAMKSLAISWISVLVILGLGSGFKNIDLAYFGGMMLAGSFVAILIVYYTPVSQKSDDKPQGHGEIVIDDAPVDVRFRPLWARTSKGGTEFSLLVLPLGGFAAIKGMHPKPDGSEVKVDKGFYSKPAWQRLIVLFAGPAFSMLLGFGLVTWSLVGRGLPEPIPVVSQFSDKSPAELAGMKVGDRLMAVNGAAISSWDDLTSKVRFSYIEREDTLVPQPLTLSIDRSGEQLTFTVVPTLTEGPEPVLDSKGDEVGLAKIQARIGVAPDVGYVPVGFVDGLSRAVKMPFAMLMQLGATATNYEVAKQTVGGPRETVKGYSQAIAEGPWEVITLAGMLSIFLGVLNLLPVPPLDGGQMMIATIEIFRGGRRISHSLQSMLHAVGMVFVVILSLAPFVIDSSRRADENAAKVEKIDLASDPSQVE